jgi:ELWxxDGT repeat protein
MPKFRGALYFGATGGLWRSDLTEEGTQLVVEFPEAVTPFPAGDSLYLVSSEYDSTQFKSTYHLWRSDGTAAGTAPVITIEGLPTFNLNNILYQGPACCVEVGRSALFVDEQFDFTINPVPIYSRRDGLELWRTDGTQAGTFRLPEIRPGPEGSRPENFRSFGSFALFTADDGIHGRELWQSDGTEAGTFMVADIVPGRRMELRVLWTP